MTHTPAATTTALTERDHAVLRFAQQTWASIGRRDTALRLELDMTPTRYMQALGHLIDQPAALQAYPTLVNRLRRLRDDRAAWRTPSRRPGRWESRST